MEEWITLFIMAGALGMDAFSVTLGMGMLKLHVRQIFKIGLTIGAFHIIMPLLGIWAGKWLSLYFGFITSIIGGGLLFLIGFQMVFSSFKNDDHFVIKPIGWGLFFFACGVSLDSFSAGLSSACLERKRQLR